MRDSWLVKQILDGDKEAGEKLVTEHYPRIYRLLRHLTASIDNAEDLTQQTFVKAWQALATFRGEASLATWRAHTCRNAKQLGGPSSSFSFPEPGDRFYGQHAVYELPNGHILVFDNGASAPVAA